MPLISDPNTTETLMILVMREARRNASQGRGSKESPRSPRGRTRRRGWMKMKMG